MELELNIVYPEGEEFETKLETINLDQEKEIDMARGKGFLIKEPPVIQKALKRTDSIYSELFTKTLQDPDSYTDRYSCECKFLQGKDYDRMICPKCRTKVQFVGEDFEMTGWITIKDEYAVIHPNLYRSLSKYIGTSTLETILEPEIDLDENGNPVTKFSTKLAKKQAKRKYTKKKSSDETFKGIGLIEFHKRFEEIMEYFRVKNKGKNENYYTYLMANKDKIFTHSIPVYTTALRPFKVENGSRFTFEGTNAIYNIMAKLAANINDDGISLYKMPKYRNILLWRLQDKLNELYNEIVAICEGKKGVIRNLIGGRCGFTSRSVIVPDPRLRIDEVTLSYHSLLELLQQTIINIMVRTYNISYNDAYMRFQQAQVVPDVRIREIIENIINTSGINILINRNPTIEYGSVLAMRCVGINDNYTMGMPLQVLKGLAAD